MNKGLNLRFFVFSFLFHLVFVTLFFYAGSFQRINKRFIVYGSPIKSIAYFKPLRVAKRVKSSGGVHIKNRKKTKLKTKKNRNVVKKVKAKKQTKKTLIPKLNEKKLKKQALAKKEIKKEVSKKNIEKKKKQLDETKKLAKEDIKKKLESKKEIKKKVEEKIEEVNEESLFGPGEELGLVLGEEMDLKYAKYQNEIQKEISRVWHPPVNLPKDAECTVVIVPGFGDVIKSVEIVKHSKIKAFNSSVKIAVPRMKFSKDLHGQRLSITFKQWV